MSEIENQLLQVHNQMFMSRRLQLPLGWGMKLWPKFAVIKSTTYHWFGGRASTVEPVDLPENFGYG